MIYLGGKSLKKIILKSLFCFIFVFSIFASINNYFCIDKQVDYTYFEKTDSWTSQNIFVDIINRSDNLYLYLYLSVIPENETVKKEETIKTQTDTLINTKHDLKYKNSLTVDTKNHLIKNIKYLVNSLNKPNMVIEITNPPTGDILYIVITILAISVVIICFTVVYSKKKKQSQNK
jgi:hypothetical protein